MRKLSSFIFLLPLSTLFLSHSVQARLNTITGGVAIGYDYDDTQYKREDIEELLPNQDTFQQQFSIAPLFIFETTSTTDGLTISFNPSLVYDLEDSQSDTDHNFSFSAHRDFTRNLTIELSDNFIYSDDPVLLEAETSSDYNRGRRRYWTNDFNINSTYTYDIESSFAAGYSYHILQNEDAGPGGYEDYDRHMADLSLQRRIDAAWNFSLFANYTRGLFDPPDPELVEIIEGELEDTAPGITDDVNSDDLSNNLSEYRFGGTLNWILSSRKIFLVNYDFSASNYDAILRYDTNLHNLTFGAQYLHTRHLSFELGAGPSYEKTETFDPNWGYNGHVNLNYDIAKRTNITAGIEKGFDQKNFSANNNVIGRDQGLTGYWNYNLTFSHQLTNGLTVSLFGAYRDEEQENILHGFINTIESDSGLDTTDRETFREESIFQKGIYEAGGSLTYTFLRWYTASLRYTYRNQDSEFINDSYDEHRAFLTLSFQKELLRW